MNAERLYGALINLLQEFEQLKLLDLLAQLETALNQSVSTSNPDTNKAFRAKYEELFNALQNSPTNNARPTQKSLYEEIGASKIVGVGLRNRLQDIFFHECSDSG
ncbi:MAG: hypothetical protein M5U26_06575 [Planctomycetota bacterium]|nr:hypothetical protein [Planctomycetota bacterium]